MSNLDSSTDGNNFDNGFEKLDPYSPGIAVSPQQDDLITSSDYTEQRTEDIKADSISSPSIGVTESVGEPLVNFGITENDTTKSLHNPLLTEVQEPISPPKPLPESPSKSSDPTPIATSCTFSGEK